MTADNVEHNEGETKPQLYVVPDLDTQDTAAVDDFMASLGPEMAFFSDDATGNEEPVEAEVIEAIEPTLAETLAPTMLGRRASFRAPLVQPFGHNINHPADYERKAQNYQDHYQSSIDAVGPLVLSLVDYFGANASPEERQAMTDQYSREFIGQANDSFPFARNRVEYNPQRETGPSMEDLSNAHEEAMADLDTTRSALARLSVERRRSMSKKRLAEAYAAADAAYRNAYEQAGATGLELLQRQGVSAEDMQATVALGTETEHANFTSAEQAVLQNSSAKLDVLSRWVAKSSKRTFAVNVLTGGFTGFGATKLIKGAKGAATGVALPIAMGAGVALRSGRAALQVGVGRRVKQHSLREERAQEDANTLQTTIAETINQPLTVDEYIARSREALQLTINNRVERDRRENKKAFIKAVGFAGIAAVAGVVVAEIHNHVQHANAIRPSVNRTPAAVRPAAPQTAPRPTLASVDRVSTPSVPAPAVEVLPPVAAIDSLSRIKVVAGEGVIGQFKAAGLSDEAAYNAFARMREANYFDGVQIPGVLDHGDQVTVYLRGSGDGTLKLPAGALQILKDAQAAYPQAA